MRCNPVHCNLKIALIAFYEVYAIAILDMAISARTTAAAVVGQMKPPEFEKMQNSFAVANANKCDSFFYVILRINHLYNPLWNV